MRRDIRFILGDADQSVADVSPTLTVLEWLRTHARACGTKEGCAEGDCGACTVLLGEPSGAAMRYRPVNACLLFVPALDGRHLVAVEHLHDADGGLHPVQRAMIDHHASQCGFCTPGIVMSLAALRLEVSEPPRGAIVQALAGNLCRCTGYRPIVDAARAANADDRAEPLRDGAVTMATRLRALPDSALDLVHDGQRYAAPRTLAEATDLAAKRPDALLLAGGTDLALLVTKQRRRLDDILALDRVAELAAVEDAEHSIFIGAGVTYEDAMPILLRHWPELGDMLGRLGSRQIRHRGTIGGNLGTASPIGDMPPALIALGAGIVFGGVTASETAAEDFFTGYRATALPPGAIIHGVRIPRSNPRDILRVYKVSKRREEDISSVCAAFALRLDGTLVAGFRAGFGGVAAIPLRAVALERAIIGRPWTRETIEHAAHALDGSILPISDMRASAEYRHAVARNLLLRLWLETSGQDSRARLDAQAA